MLCYVHLYVYSLVGICVIAPVIMCSICCIHFCNVFMCTFPFALMFCTRCVYFPRSCVYFLPPTCRDTSWLSEVETIGDIPVSASNRNWKRSWMFFLGAVLAKPAKSKPVGANLLCVWTFHCGKYFRCFSCKMWQKKFNWIRGRLLVGGYLNINIPIMESGAGSGHGKVRGPRSAAHTRFKSCCNSFYRKNKISN